MLEEHLHSTYLQGTPVAPTAEHEGDHPNLLPQARAKAFSGHCSTQAPQATHGVVSSHFMNTVAMVLPPT